MPVQATIQFVMEDLDYDEEVDMIMEAQDKIDENGIDYYLGNNDSISGIVAVDPVID